MNMNLQKAKPIALISLLIFLVMFYFPQPIVDKGVEVICLSILQLTFTAEGTDSASYRWTDQQSLTAFEDILISHSSHRLLFPFEFLHQGSTAYNIAISLDNGEYLMINLTAGEELTSQLSPSSTVFDYRLNLRFGDSFSTQLEQFINTHQHYSTKEDN